MLWGTYHHQNGDLTKLLKLVRKKSAPECPVECGGGGGNRNLGNAQIEVATFLWGLPLANKQLFFAQKTNLVYFFTKNEENTRVCEIHFSDDAFIPDDENKDARGRKRAILSPLHAICNTCWNDLP